MNKFGAASGPETGQTMAEYAVTLSVIIIAVVATLGLFSSSVSTMVNNVVALI